MKHDKEKKDRFASGLPARALAAAAVIAALAAAAGVLAGACGCSGAGGVEARHSASGGACAVYTESDATLHLVSDPAAVTRRYAAGDVGPIYSGIEELDASREEGGAPWASDGIAGRIECVSVEEGFAPRSMAYWFAGCPALSWVEWPPGMDASRLESVEGAFMDCTRLGSAEADTGAAPNLRNASFMFSGCSSLKAADLEGFDSSCVEDVRCMFSGCSALSNLRGEGGLVGASCKDVSSMFGGCASLPLLEMDGWDVSGVERANGMFRGCSSMESALGVRNWTMGALVDASYMFGGCASLDYIPVPGMPAVESAHHMFEGCTGLGTLDLTGMGTAALEDTTAMFRGCSSLEDVWVSPDWDVSHVASSDEMFSMCGRLRGEWGCSVNAEGVYDKTFARADKGPSQKGYLIEGAGGVGDE